MIPEYIAAIATLIDPKWSEREDARAVIAAAYRIWGAGYRVKDAQ